MDSWITPQLKAAVLRALGLAVVAAGTTFFTALGGGATLQVAAVSAGGAAFAALGIRGAIEGLYDGKRAATGDVKPADVGQAPAA